MKKTDCIKTFVPAVIVLASTLPRGWGFLLVLLLPLFLIYALYNGVRMIRRPAERKSRGLRLAVWSVAFALAGSVQAYWSVAARNDAEVALHRILAYHERAGSYPANLRGVGLDDRDLQEKRGIRYSMKDGKPRLVFPAAVMPLSMHEYDFENHQWWENAY